MLGKKGQAAMEFLMTYGWAILVVLIVIGALAYFGVLNPGRLLPSRCTMPSGVVCEDYVANAGDNSIHLRFSNGLGREITVNNVSIIPGEGNTISGNCDSANDLGNIQNGESLDVTSVCLPTLSTYASGTKFRWDVAFNYRYADSTAEFDKTMVGELLTNIEP